MADQWNMAGVLLAASRVAWNIDFFKDAPGAPQAARQLLATVECLKTSASDVRNGFHARPHPDIVEQKNRNSTIDLVNRCGAQLRTLADVLPDAPKDLDDSAFEALKTSLAQRLCQDSVGDIITGITLCNNALQVEIQALTAFEMEEAGTYSHMTIRGQWKKVLRDADDQFSNRPFMEGHPELEECLDSFVDSLHESASTSEGRSVVHDHPEATTHLLDDARSPNRRNSRQASITPKSTLTYQRDDDSGCEVLQDIHEIPSSPSSIPPRLNSRVLPAILRKVEEHMLEGDFEKAAGYQVRLIQYRRECSGGAPIDTFVACRDEIQLAEIYRLMATAPSRRHAEEILRRTMERVKTEKFDPPEIKSSLIAELCHDLGRICVELKKLDPARTYLTEAFDMLSRTSRKATPLLRSVGIMLHRIYVDTGRLELAEALDDYGHRQCKVSVKVLAWCEEQGFDIGEEDFFYDRCATITVMIQKKPHTRSMSPLHRAAQTGRDDIVQQMLQDRVNLEVEDGDHHSTPLLLACAQQDILIVELLLKHRANIAATDQKGQNGLHLCQRAEGGTKVAQCLLGHPSRAIDIDALDGCHNTALHLATSMGNVPMVKLLLGMGANPNAEGLGGYTPLMAGVEATMKTPEAKWEVLKTLVERGASTTLEYEGQTAVDMANDAQIKKKLSKLGKKQSSKQKWRFPLRGKS